MKKKHFLLDLHMSSVHIIIYALALSPLLGERIAEHFWWPEPLKPFLGDRMLNMEEATSFPNRVIQWTVVIAMTVRAIVARHKHKWY